MDIKNIQLKISDSCMETDKEIIKLYWQFEDDSLEFNHKPTMVRNKFNISQSELNNTIQTESALTFHIHCIHCNSYEENKAQSQTSFNQATKVHRSFRSENKCRHCSELQKEKELIQHQEERDALIENLDNAVTEKRWENLTEFQHQLLNRCLTENFSEIKKHYWNELGRSQYKRLFIELEALAYLNLIVIHTDIWTDRVTGYRVYDRLKKEFEYRPKLSEPKTEHEIFKETSGQLKFRLTINKGSHHPDSPKYAGIITFKERIVIEPNVEYTFAQWERAGDHLYLTLIPTDEVYPAPNQLPISRLPTSLQDGIQSFLRSIKPF